ncbi:MAG TPA: hypothetical protein VN493_13480 [Thermoanaerobaculia bacterium]|nr:hypothetical protein [Thermoanaerobaculia bacterium]
MIRKAFPIPIFLLLLAACDRNGETMPDDTAAQTPAAPSEAPVGPISSRGEQVGGGSPMAGQAQEGSIGFDLPSNWQEQPPTTSMRMAQAVIPGNPPGDLVVFYFGPGGGGGVEANIQRWIDQMEVEPGSSLQPETFETNGFRVTWIDVSGTLKPSNMGTGPATEQPGSRLMGAVVEGPGGPWFFKATGPEATLAAERENFVKMLRSVRGQ